MLKLLQINPVVRRNTSTGKIMREVGEHAIKHGWESYIAYSKGRDGFDPDAYKSILVPVGDKLSVAVHGLETRLFDRHGLSSRIATKRFVKQIIAIDPDVIHIHNIHGYFLNYKILFNYLKDCGKPVIWTVHDCWLYTGHCYHYASVGCDKWRSGCHDCPQKKAFPTSILLDRSKQNFKDKSTAFNSIPKDKLTIVTVSEWMKGEMSHSFLKGCNFKVIHNGIDTEIFKPSVTSSIRERYNLGDKHIILGLASIWSKEKGFDDMLRLAQMTKEDEVIVIVGKLTEEQKKLLPETVVTIARTENQQQLAELYSAATVLINPTWQDNYPTVNLEAISCGTPVITYRTGGSPESIVEDETGFVVEQGDIAGIIACMRFVEQTGKAQYTDACRAFALDNFRKEDRYQQYIELYKELAKTDKNDK